MQLKILSWNIWYDGYFDKVSEFLRASGADIIALQEIVPADTTRDVIGFLANLGYTHVFAPSFTAKDSRKVGNAIFSKHQILNSRIYRLSEAHARSALSADIKIGGTTLHIFTTHLLHTHQQPSETQELQADNLIKVLPADHTIVMGDFNATPKSAAIKNLRAVLTDADPTDAPTWSVYPGVCPVCGPQGLDTRLDYIFTTKDIKTSAFQVENSKGSDHVPIVALYGR